MLRLALVAIPALSLLGCVPSLPGTNTNLCVFCLHSSASTAVGTNPNRPSSPDGPLSSLPDTALEGAAGAVPEAGDGSGEAAAPVDQAVTEPPPPPTEAEAEPGPDLAQRIRDAEGFCYVPCRGPKGGLHLGYGRRITTGEAMVLPGPITIARAEELLSRDLADARSAAERVVGEPVWSGLTRPRREVLIELAYMVGEDGLRKFERMLGALHAGDWRQASIEVIVSALRPPARVARLSTMMREG